MFPYADLMPNGFYYRCNIDAIDIYKHSRLFPISSVHTFIELFLTNDLKVYLDCLFCIALYFIYKFYYISFLNRYSGVVEQWPFIVITAA